MCDNLIFGELPPQTAYVLGSFCDLRLQAGGVSHLWTLLVHPLHLLQCFTEVRRQEESVNVSEMQALVKEVSVLCKTVDKDRRYKLKIGKCDTTLCGFSEVRR